MLFGLVPGLRVGVARVDGERRLLAVAAVARDEVASTRDDGLDLRIGSSCVTARPRAARRTPARRLEPVRMLATQICGWDARNSVARASSSGMPMSTQILRIASSTSVMPSASFVRNWDSSVCFCSSGMKSISSIYSWASCMN